MTTFTCFVTTGNSSQKLSPFKLGIKFKMVSPASVFALIVLCVGAK
jgi:hypothetical protein